MEDIVSEKMHNSDLEQREQEKGEESKKGFIYYLWNLCKRWLPILGVFFLALAVRVIYNKTVAHAYVPTYDAAVYQLIAQNLLQKHCYCVYGSYVSVSRPPLWPWILTFIYAFTGVHAVYARAFYCLLGSGTCVLVYLFAKELFAATVFGKYVAFLTGLMAAIYAGLFIYDGWLYSESLYTFCLMGFAYTLLRLQQTLPTVWEKGKSWRSFFFAYRWAFLCALFLAAAMLTRPNGASLVGLVVVWAFILVVFRMASWQKLLVPTAIILVLTFLLVLPWTYRNYVVSGQFVLVSTGTGEVLKGAYNDNVLKGPSAKQGFWSPPGGGKTHDQVGYTPVTDKQDTAKAVTWIKSHLSEMPHLLWLHYNNMWEPYTYSHGLPMEEFPNRSSSKSLMKLLYWQTYRVYWLAEAGCLLTLILLRKKLIILYLIVLYTIAQNVATYGMMRFRAPIEPFLILLVGGAFWMLLVIISWLWSFMKKGAWHKLSLRKA